jgi:tRNA threonylcarbamoyladenosine modification (KEOPS) complex  Pcc1 subunit
MFSEIFKFSKMLYSTNAILLWIKMCYDIEIPEKVKQKNRNVLDKEDQEIELEIEPMTVSN